MKVEGADLHVEVDGSNRNPALLLWPSGSANTKVWQHLVPYLTERFRVIRIDIRGVGRSTVESRDDSQFTFKRYAADAAAVLDNLAIARCHVWAQSWGSRAAIVFCALHTSRVVSASLYAANLDLPDVAAQRRGSEQARQERVELEIQTSSNTADFTSHTNPETVSHAMGAVRRVELSDLIDELRMPLLIGTGTHDPNLTSSREIARRLPNAKLIEFQHVGHNAILEHPQLALDTFLSFQDELNQDLT